MVKVGVIGASGYTGAELLRLCAQHPEVEVVCATGDSQAGTLASVLYPSLAAAYPNLVFEEFNADRFVGLDAVFLGVPHEAALEIAPQLVGRVGVVIDLSAAYRLKDASLYPQWYGFEHTQPELLAQAVYGLPELYRSELVGARLIATPGCYVTAASLALTPLVQSGIISPLGVIVDAASGVSGAGRALKHSSMFSTIDEDFTAYGLLDHRHTPEIEQVTGAQVLFTPASLLAAIAKFYKNEQYVVVRPSSPSTKATLGSNSVHITARFDERTGYVMVIAALDNLAKGASGGAVQSMNVALGLSESYGLSNVGVYP